MLYPRVLGRLPHLLDRVTVLDDMQALFSVDKLHLAVQKALDAAQHMLSFPSSRRVSFLFFLITVHPVTFSSAVSISVNTNHLFVLQC